MVTGAASGLGLAAALGLAEAGATVVGIDLAGPDPAATSSSIHYAQADVTDPEQLLPIVRAAADLGPLRAVVNCAGIAPAERIWSPRRGRHDHALFSRVLHVNLAGTFHVMAACVERMVETEPHEDGQRGVIVNTASVAAFDGQVGQVAYAASKGGVAAMTLPAARDLAEHGIRVCAIAPGTVETPMLKSVTSQYRERLAQAVPFPRRLARPDEFAQLVRAIIDHDYLNGEVIRMDGALRMAPR